jgi:lactocepin
MTGIVTTVGEDAEGNKEYEFLGEDVHTGELDPNKIAFSPGDDGEKDDALMILSFLRNAKEVTFNVLDENKNKLRTITTESDVRKNYYDGGLSPMYSLSSARAWDGKIDGKVAPEGNYYLQAEGVIDWDGASQQSLEIPVILDTTAPELEAEFDANAQKVTVHATDNEGGSGLAYWDVRIDGKSILDKVYTEEDTEHQLNKKLKPDQTLTIVAVDYAGNETTVDATEAKDTTAPDLHVKTPEFLGVESSKEVTFTGYVTDKSGVKEVTIDGEQAELVYNEAEDRYDFTYTLIHEEDGFYFHHIRAVDQAGNEAEIGRRYFVDSTAASLQINVDETTEEATVYPEINIQDNFDEITFYVNESEVYKHELSEPYGMNGFEETINDVELDLTLGENNFELKVVDLGGHETTESITIERNTSIAMMQNIVDELKQEGDIADDATARTLTMQLTAIGHYVDSDQYAKATKHMKSFKELVGMLKETDKLTEQAANTLNEHADYLMDSWQ